MKLCQIKNSGRIRFDDVSCFKRSENIKIKLDCFFYFLLLKHSSLLEFCFYLVIPLSVGEDFELGLLRQVFANLRNRKNNLKIDNLL